MIELGLLREFLKESLFYKNPEVISYQVIGKFIYINLGPFGETIDLQRYFDWLSQKRVLKIDNILK
jgi:hypothetical protein